MRKRAGQKRLPRPPRVTFTPPPSKLKRSSCQPTNQRGGAELAEVQIDYCQFTARPAKEKAGHAFEEARLLPMLTAAGDLSAAPRAGKLLQAATIVCVCVCAKQQAARRQRCGSRSRPVWMKLQAHFGTGDAPSGKWQVASFGLKSPEGSEGGNRQRGAAAASRSLSFQERFDWLLWQPAAANLASISLFFARRSSSSSNPTIVGRRRSFAACVRSVGLLNSPSAPRASASLASCFGRAQRLMSQQKAENRKQKARLQRSEHLI